ncbi:MAG TPA: hypothetical protein VGC39_10915 [Candidatus Methylacidiphilales bacterium]
MKPLFSLFSCLALLAITSSALAAAPSTNAAPVAPAPAKDTKPGAQAKPAPVTETVAAPAPAPASQPEKFKFDDYIKELADTLKLTDDEKKNVQTYYLADGISLKAILNNEALSPLQQAQQVSDLRDARNAKINALLQDVDRQQAFLKVEAQYRVALTELAAEGGLVPAPAPPPVPAPAGKAPDAKPETK